VTSKTFYVQDGTEYDMACRHWSRAPEVVAMLDVIPAVSEESRVQEVLRDASGIVGCPRVAKRHPGLGEPRVLPNGLEVFQHSKNW
jgi:hypothetical protein